jgi:TolA-binding protein
MHHSQSRSQRLRNAARCLVGGAALAFVLAAPSAPAFAQSNTELRLNKVEGEVRALQRKVFPGSGDRVFSPEISAPTPTPSASLPSTSALSDVLTRMDALEGQVARLTGQVEQNTNRITQLEARLALAGQGTAPATGSAAPAAASQSNLDAMTGGASIPRPSAATPAPAAASQPTPSRPATPPSSSRVQAVSAVVKPSTGDAVEDEYSYGFRLWEAKFYPEAQQQLKLFLEKHARTPRASWARNLLGRAYLDDSNPLEAAKWFVQNYQTDKRGERAPDSLLYLAVSMKALKDTKRACIALAEFGTTYAAEAAGRLKSTYDATRNGLQCSA